MSQPEPPGSRCERCGGLMGPYADPDDVWCAACVLFIEFGVTVRPYRPVETVELPPL